MILFSFNITVLQYNRQNELVPNSQWDLFNGDLLYLLFILIAIESPVILKSAPEDTEGYQKGCLRANQTLK